ncbi:hypothetical protein ABT124_17955 [Streptomyces sp. NPDC001982]|uniref:hypothetical protein n=1 Tax=Streptomyces sp. NPDC001982 TaxID=3154405 RepID=UPI0033216A61
MAEIKRCKNGFATAVDGVTRVVSSGELVSTDDPVYTRDRRDLFEDVTTHVSQQAAGRARAAGKGVEQATAAPGEKRDLTPPAPFDPAEHNVADVLAYLGTVDRDEALRVLDAEAGGKKRSTILALREQYEGPSNLPPADPDGDDA